jgi:hypothetical protein
MKSLKLEDVRAYLNKNEGEWKKNENILHVGILSKMLSEKLNDVALEFFVKKNTPRNVLNIPDFIKVNGMDVRTIIIEGEGEYKVGVPDYKMPKSLNEEE